MASPAEPLHDATGGPADPPDAAPAEDPDAALADGAIARAGDRSIDSDDSDDSDERAGRPTVRPATESEIDEVAALWGEMYAHQQAHGMTLPLRDDAVEIWKRQLAGRLDSPVSVVLVAPSSPVGGGPLLGFLAAQTKRLPPHLAAARPKVGFISELFVRPEARRRRAGRALVDAALAWFARADVGSIELHVLVGNDGARRFWEQVGFVPELLQMRRG
ncbi:MAG TPA: GNAT family N-acetyltransferase [Kofleriaceae bacterium]|nr:GNAT family N-acetyltransferase [Kofleriaceae bacterium]